MAKVHELLPGVYHIELAMDVCATLLVGKERALLVDTGFGVDDLRAIIKGITLLPVDVILTHGHFDHILGACQFERSAMFAEDLPDYMEYTSPEKRRWVLDCAREAGVRTEHIEENFLNAEFAQPERLREGSCDLGGLTAQVVHIPGHTPGSAVVLVPERRLLLTGDNWNPCTWLFFERALPVKEYRDNLNRMLELPFDRAVCSHRTALYDRSVVEKFAKGLTDAALENAPAVSIEPYGHINTHELQIGDEQRLVFDRDRL